MPRDPGKLPAGAQDLRHQALEVLTPVDVVRDPALASANQARDDALSELAGHRCDLRNSVVGRQLLCHGPDADDATPPGQWVQ